jgi:hypothetical protein
MGGSVRHLILLSFFIFSNGFLTFQSPKNSQYASSLLFSSSEVKYPLAEIDFDDYYGFLDVSQPLTEDSQSTIFMETTLAEDKEKLKARRLGPKLTKQELILKMYKEENQEFIRKKSNAEKKILKQSIEAYEEQRGRATWTGRSEDQLRVDREKRKRSEPNWPLERVIIAVFHEKSQTMRSLKGVDDTGLEAYRSWLNKAREEDPAKDPVPAKKAELIDQWIRQEPWSSIMSQYLDESARAGRILYPTSPTIGPKVFPRSRPTIVILPNGEERFIAPPKPRVLVGGLPQIKPPKWPPAIVLDEACPLMDYASDRRIADYLQEISSTAITSNSPSSSSSSSSASSSSSSSGVFAPLQTPSIRNWLKKEEELKEDPYHTTIAPPALPPSSLPVSSSATHSMKTSSVFVVDDEELFVPSVFAAEDNDHEYFIVL